MASRGMDLLTREVIDKGLCVSCGGCVGLCPHITFFDGKVICIDKCDLDEGRCYDVCPRVSRNKDLPVPAEPVGTVIGIYRSRAVDKTVRRKAQYGGTITALANTALKEGLISEAILTSDGRTTSPHGVIAKTENEATACSGSRYSAAAALEAFNRRMKKGPAHAGIVALPCQAQSLALAKKSSLTQEETKWSIELVLGLFCTWSLSHRKLDRFLKEKGLPEGISRYDIPPPPAEIFQVFVNGESHEFPLSELRSFVNKGCSLCTDMTAEKSDVSVGAVEGRSGWNTLIIRTPKGKALVDLAIKKGMLELTDQDPEILKHLYEAARLKRERGLENSNSGDPI